MKRGAEVDWTIVKCPLCEGAGRIPYTEWIGTIAFQRLAVCSACDGAGFVETLVPHEPPADPLARYMREAFGAAGRRVSLWDRD